MDALKLSGRDRAIKIKSRALATDDQGREVLVGLDRPQSEWLLAMLQHEVASMTEDNRRRYLNLYTLHEAARADAIGDPRIIDV
jgi:hypothetical protein